MSKTPVRSVPDFIHLERFGHETFEEGVCLLELAAYLGYEEHTDSPRCVSPVLTYVGRNLNDSPIFADHLHLLRPFAERLVGTAASPEVEQTRLYLLVDWITRDILPSVLDQDGHSVVAATLREEVVPIVDAASASQAAALLHPLTMWLIYTQVRLALTGIQRIPLDEESRDVCGKVMDAFYGAQVCLTTLEGQEALRTSALNFLERAIAVQEEAHV